MIDPEHFDTAALPLSKLILELENWALFDIARRIAKAGRITETAEYQLLRLAEMRGFNEDYRKKLAELLKKSLEEIDRLYWEAAEKAHVYDKDLFLALDKKWIPLRENAFYQNLVPAMIRQTQGEMVNLTRSTALKFLSPYKKFVPLPEAFRQHLDFAEMKVSTGVQDYNAAIKEAVRTLSDGGLRIIRYENEGKRKVVRRLETVVRMNVLTGLSQLAGQVSVHNVMELDARHVQVSHHLGARTGKGGGFGDITNHQFWQGKIYSLSNEFFKMANPSESLKNDANNDIVNPGGGGMNILPRADEAVIPDAKISGYALDPIKSRGKSVAFQEALGYNLHNAELLADNIRKNIKNFPAVNKGNTGYGETYAVLMELTGVNGKTANVMTAWLDDARTGEIRLTSTYIKKRKGG